MGSVSRRLKNLYSAHVSLDVRAEGEGVKLLHHGAELCI